MKKNNPTINSTLRLLMLFLLLTLAVFVACYLFYKMIEGENQQVSMISNTIDSQGEEETQFQSLKDTLNATAGQRAAVDALILPSDGFVPFVESIEALGKQQKVAFTDSLSTSPDGDPTFAADGTDPGTEFLVVQIQMTGTWANVMNTISLIESLPYAEKIDTVVLNQSGEVGKKPTWEASLSLDVVKYK